MQKLFIVLFLCSVYSYAVASPFPAGITAEYRIQDCFDIHINNNDVPDSISYMVMEGSQVLISGNLSNNSTIKFCEPNVFTTELDEIVPLTPDRSKRNMSYKLILDGMSLDKNFNSRVEAAINISHEYKFNIVLYDYDDVYLLGPGIDSIDYDIEGPNFMFPRGDEYTFEADSIYYADTVNDPIQTWTTLFPYGNVKYDNVRTPKGYIFPKMFNVSEVHKLNLNLPSNLFLDGGDTLSFKTDKLALHRDIDFAQHADNDTTKFFERRLPYLETANLIDDLNLSVSYDPNHFICGGLLYDKYKDELSGYCIATFGRFMYAPEIPIQRILLPLKSCPSHKITIVDIDKGKMQQSIQCE